MKYSEAAGNYDSYYKRRRGAMIIMGDALIEAVFNHVIDNSP
jgi:hypothetical protein